MNDAQRKRMPNSNSSELLDAEVAKHRNTFPDVKHIGPEELQKMIEAGPVTLIDVRSREEQQISMLPGAVPLQDLQMPLPPNIPVVTYCTVGFRSSLEARRLSAVGADECASMSGILSWAHIGGALVSPAGRKVRSLHAYGAAWAAMAPPNLDEIVTFTPSSVFSLSFLWSIVRLPLVWLHAKWFMQFRT